MAGFSQKRGDGSKALRIRVCSRFKCDRDRARFFARQGMRREIWSLQMEGETQQRTKSAPSLRAALKISPYGASAFAKGMTLGCTLRLVWQNFEQ